MKYEPADLREDTRVVADADHPAEPGRPQRWYANISPAWNIMYVFGGTTMAAAVSAARAARTQPGFELLSASGTFRSPIKPGRVALDTRVLRAGKGAEQISVDLSDADEKPALHLVASFGPTRPSDTELVDVRCPDVPDPEAIPEHVPKPGSAMLMIPYYHNVETRVVTKASRVAADHGARWCGWHRFKVAPRMADGNIDPIAYVAACDMIAPALRVGRGRGATPQLVVSLEINLHFYQPT